MNLQKCAVIGCGAVGATTRLHPAGQRTVFRAGAARHRPEEGGGRGDGHRPRRALRASRQRLRRGLPRSGRRGAGDHHGGAAQAPGETRIDLVRKNVKIFRSIVPQIVRCNRDAILLVVANPVDILTYVTLKLSGFPASRVIGSGTVLDTARFKYLLGEHLEVDPAQHPRLHHRRARGHRAAGVELGQRVGHRPRGFLQGVRQVRRHGGAARHLRGGQEQRLPDHRAQGRDQLRDRQGGAADRGGDRAGRELGAARFGAGGRALRAA